MVVEVRCIRYVYGGKNKGTNYSKYSPDRTNQSTEPQIGTHGTDYPQSCAKCPIGNEVVPKKIRESKSD